jgi:hypothetical protein
MDAASGLTAEEAEQPLAEMGVSAHRLPTLATLRRTWRAAAVPPSPDQTPVGRTPMSTVIAANDAELVPPPDGRAETSSPDAVRVLWTMLEEAASDEDGHVAPRTAAATRCRLRQALEAAMERVGEQRLLALLDQTTGELAGYLAEYLQLLASLQRCEVLLGQAERILDEAERLVAAESAPVEDRGRRAADGD